MKKFLLSFAIVVGFLLYVFDQRGGGDNSPKVIAPSGSQTNSSSSNQKVQSSTSTSDPNSSGTTNPISTNNQSSGTYKDGSYTGNVADAYYGNVQVQAFISGGKISDVKFLQYPNDRQNSIYINSQAMPYLTQEAITAQNAQVDIISGATDTSMAFQQSLANALNQAH